MQNFIFDVININEILKLSLKHEIKFMKFGAVWYNEYPE